jgi:hypothetical protein
MAWKTVDYDGFKAFIQGYPRPLQSDVCGISEPEFVSYNDFDLGPWPDSVVAKYHNYADRAKRVYQIFEEIESA